MMEKNQLLLLKQLLNLSNDDSLDSILEFYLETAGDIICDIRNSDKVESQYLNTQIRIAIEMYSKMGAEGQTSHNENGISRSYEKGDISPSILMTIVPVGKTPFSKVRVIGDD